MFCITELVIDPLHQSDLGHKIILVNGCLSETQINGHIIGWLVHIIDQQQFIFIEMLPPPLLHHDRSLENRVKHQSLSTEERMRTTHQSKDHVGLIKVRIVYRLPIVKFLFEKKENLCVDHQSQYEDGGSQ